MDLCLLISEPRWKESFNLTYLEGLGIDMKCPDCGAEMAYGHLYCEKCGREIQIVPDFEPEIENSITETLSTVGEEIEGGSLKDDQGIETAVDIHGLGKKKHKNRSSSFFSQELGKNGMILAFVIFFVVLLAGAFLTLHLYHRFSAAYQIEQARYYAQLGEYEEAVGYLEKAKKLEADVVEVAFLESNYYYQLGEKQKAAEVLVELITSEPLEYGDEERAYSYVIDIWDEEEKYTDINWILSECRNNEIVNQFQQYIARMPEFGYEPGSYDEVVLLKISANTTGKIYYTLDGSTPDQNSSVYIAPLILESGEYQVAALFVNDYGIESEVARSWYVINLTVPDPPELLLYSGSFHVPTMIEVVEPESGTVHYTMDGSNPTKDSPKYTGPISMPLGRSNFKFITVSEEGVSSEIVSRSFDFTLETDVTVSKAVNNVTQALFDRKVLSDLQGHSHEIMGKYVFKYNTIVEIPDMGYYYVLDEYIEAENGEQTKTDRLYAVEVYTGAPNRLIYDENGQMGLISLSTP